MHERYPWIAFEQPFMNDHRLISVVATPECLPWPNARKFNFAMDISMAAL